MPMRFKLCVGLLIVFQNDRFCFVFQSFQKRSFRFWGKQIVFYNDPLVLNFRKRITIVFENDRFLKTIFQINRFKNDHL